MGMSASQARLLSITSRLTNNELNSQLISNSKLRLASETDEVSNTYMNALSSKKLMYMSYNDKGEQTKVDLTPAVIYEYADLKNQYVIMNAANKIMVTSDDADHFERYGNSLDDFLRSYDGIYDSDGNMVNKTKAQWYTNLWYKMNGSDTANKWFDETAEDGTTQFSIYHPQEFTGQGFYEIIENNLYNSSTWIEFALEHGIVTLERADFYNPSENNEKALEMSGEGIVWNSIIYTNSSDIVAVDDEKAISIAEVKYKKAMNEIQAKDKKYDQDLKKLDTEHNALQTEYDVVKDIISKNVDRSFKAFS